MSDEVENRATIEAFWLAWNEERFDDAIEMHAPDARLRHLNLGIDVTGTNNIRDLMAKSLAMFPGRRSDVGRIFAAGDDVITENHWHVRRGGGGGVVSEGVDGTISRRGCCRADHIGAPGGSEPSRGAGQTPPGDAAEPFAELVGGGETKMADLVQALDPRVAHGPLRDQQRPDRFGVAIGTRTRDGSADEPRPAVLV